MMRMGKDTCKALSDKAGMGVIVLLFTSGTEILEKLILILNNENNLQWCL